MKNILALCCIVLLVVGFGSCKQNPVEPEPGRRDYTWKVDTIKNKYCWITRCSAVSANDVWEKGFGDSQYWVWHSSGSGLSPSNTAISRASATILIN